MTGKRTVHLAYSKDQLNFPSFKMLYRYTAASQQLLDNWEEKRITGFRLSWRIENPTVKWTTSISEVGRSIQTPRLGDAFDKPVDESSDHIYKAVLTMPGHFQENIGNGSLVIELASDMRKEDEMVDFRYSLKLYRERETWEKADAHCKSEGGQLASINSESRQALVEKAVDGEDGWLGGRREEGSEGWNWSDNSTWGFTNWDRGPGEYDDLCLVMEPSGEWSYIYCLYSYYFLCQADVAVTQENGLTRLEMKKDQLKFFPFYVFFKSKALNKQMKNSSDEEKRMTCFTLNWFLKDSNGTRLIEKLPPRQEDWRQEVPSPKYKQPLLTEMIHLARKLRLQNMPEEDILEEVIRGKVEGIKILEKDGMCSMGQIQPEHQKESFSRLVSSVNINQTVGPSSAEDIKTGFKLFQALVFCPRMVIKLFRFINQLLSNEHSKTIIQTFVNLFQSGAIADKTSFTLARQFYFVLASTLNLQYGNVLQATSTNAQ